MSDNRGIKFSELDILVDVPGNYHVHIFSGEDKTNYKVRVTRLIDNISEEIGEREGLATREWVKAQVEAAEGYYELKDEEGNIISSGKVTINETVEVIAPNANYIVKDNDGFLITSGAIASGGTEDIIIDNTIVTIYDSNNDILYSEVVSVGGDYDVNIKDSQAIIKDSSGNTLKSESILAEGTKDITVQDSEVDVKNTTGSTLYSENILAEGSKDITVQDSEVEIKNSAGSTLYSENIPAEQSEELTIQDSTATIKDTDNNTLYSESILAEDSKDITIQDSTFTVKNSEDNVLKQDSILAQGSGEYTVQDSEVVIKDKFGNIIEQDTITAEGSKEFTVNTELPVKNTEGDEVGTEINEEIIVGDSNAIIKDSSGNTLKSENILAEGSKDITIQDSQVTLKNTKDETLSSENILAESSKEITAPDSNFKITDFSGNNTFIEGEIASGSNEEFEIWAKDYRPLIFKYDTTLNGNNEIRLRGTGNDMKYITVKDEQGEILEEFNTTDNNISITNYPIGKYYIEIRQREGDYFRFSGNNAQIQATLVELVQFGDVIWNSGDLGYLFNACSELTIKADDEMIFREGAITNLNYAFNIIKSVENSKWIENFPFSQVEGGMYSFFHGTPNFDFDTLTIDLKGAEGIESMGNFFAAYQIGGSNGIQTFIIKNMESSLNITGNILSSFAWSNGLKKVIFQGLKVSQSIAAWRPTDPINVMLFFLNLGDLTGETQATITLRTQEWDLLSNEQKDVIDEVLINKNWALSLI